MINKEALGITKTRTDELKIEYVDIHSLFPNEYNPNRHSLASFNLLLKSVSMFGFTQPIVVRKGTNVIIDGEHRWRVASILDILKIPAIFLELNDEEMRIATIIHNKARGTEDGELISKIDDYMKGKNIDLKKEMLEFMGDRK